MVTELIESTNENIRDMIYTIRGQQVMLDSDLAMLYGYETKNFNRQVKNNSEKFEGEEFMFQLTKEETENLVRCKNFTSPKIKGFKGQDGGRRYYPYVFTEQGIYMLMTVLKGELATKQSRQLVKTFKEMRHYIIENKQLLTTSEYELLSKRIDDNYEDIKDMKLQI